MNQVDGAVDAFREGIFRPQDWSDALDKVAAGFDAALVTIVHNVRERELTYSRQGHEAIDRYLNHREIPDSRQNRVNPTLNEGFRTDFDDFDADEIARDPYYQEFLAPLGVRWHAAAALPGFDEPVIISFKRSPDRGPFTSADVLALNRALPFFRATARQAALVSHVRFQGELAAFARLGMGALYVDYAGRIIGVNDCVTLGDGIGVLGRRLIASGGDGRCALAQALRAACDIGAPSPVGPIIVRRPSGKRPYLVDVISLPADDLARFGRSRALVVINDLDRKMPVRRQSVIESFGLTEREADLALCLAAGATVRDAAHSMGITEAHARQRLKSVLEKSQTSRQAQLLALLARMR